MKILIIGFGSIGKRHYNILKKLKACELAVLRRATSRGENTEEATCFFSLEDALAYQPDGVIVCTPTNQHISQAMPFLEQGAKVLFEKPISDQLEDLTCLEPFEQQIRVAYCLRFMPLYLKVKEVLNQHKVVRLNFRDSFYLPNWHPMSDYRKEYAARKDLGGGAALTMSHQMDLALSWFGEVEKARGFKASSNVLECDVDDQTLVTFKCKDGPLVHINVDYFSPIASNSGEAFTLLGHLVWDMHQIKYCAYDSKEWDVLDEFSEGDRLSMYDEQMVHFVNFLENKDEELATLCDGKKVLTLIDGLEVL